MASNKDINIRINAKDRASGVFAKVGRGLGGFERRLSNIGFSLASLPAALGATGLLAFGAKAVAAAAEQEKAERSLAAALKLVGDGRRESLDDLKQYASGLQQITTYGDEALLQLMSLGATSGQLAGRDLKRATVAAIGLSKAFGIDTVAAMRLVARAAVGDTAQLKRYGIIIEQTLPTQEKFNELLKIGERNFSLATDEVNTLAGGIQQLKNALGDTMEILGSAAPGGDNNWFAQQAQGVSALNAALQDTDSELNSVLETARKVFAQNANAVTLGAFTAAGSFGDFLGTKLTEDQLNLKPSQEAIDAWNSLTEAQKESITNGEKLATDQFDAAQARAKLEASITAMLRDQRSEVLGKELEKLDEAAQKEQTRLDTLDKINARYADLARALADANAEQARQISEQLAGLRRLRDEREKARQQSLFEKTGEFRNAVEQEQLNRLRDRAEGGDKQAQIDLARAQASAEIQRRIAALDKFGSDDSLPLEVREQAQQMIRELMWTIEAQAQKRAADTVREQQRREVEAAQKDAAAAAERAQVLPELISGRLLTGITSAFRSGQERANPNKGVEDRVDKGNRTQAMMLKRMEDMLAVLRAGRNPILGVGSI